jgi:hypothetical protein
MSNLRRAVTRRRGMVLIIVLSVLAVMAILGISHFTQSALDKTVTDNHFWQVQARQMARSGIEDATARLRDGAVLRSAFDTDNDWMFRGDDVTGNEPAKRVTPLAWSRVPSFAKKGANGSNETIQLWRDDLKSIVEVGVSGTSSGKFHTRSNVYSLEVRDLSSCIYLNDGVHLYGANNSSVSQNLGRVLNRLGENSKIGISQLGTLVLRLRPSTGFASLQDFRTTMKTKGQVTDLQLDRLQRYVTTIAWIDKNVVNPAPLSHAVLDHYPVKYERGDGDSYIFRRGPGKDFKNEDRSKDVRLGWMPDFGGITGQGGVTARVYGQDEMYPTYVEVTHRAPVNINTAEEPVLIALLADLKGFFILERRSGHPFGGDTPSNFNYNTQWPQTGASVATGNKLPPGVPVSFDHARGWFTFENMGHTYSDHQWKARIRVEENMDWRSLYGATTPSTLSGGLTYEPVEDHDAIGDLWITASLTSGDGSGTVAGGVSAKAIAQEIMNCRTRQGRYAASPFGGPFKNWAQFYAFCDNLVEVRKDGQPGAGVIRDDRFAKEEERRQAAQAMCDVLKANFNPNFTPNEINPDHNLHLLVDKTDLVVNSTEFCFLPTGLFSISSAGRVVRDRESNTRASHGGSGTGPQEIVAQSRIDAVVRAYDVYRETNQRHFYLGDATPAEDCSYTNNGQTVETGPEPDNAPMLYNEHLGAEQKFIRHTPDVDGYAGDTTIEGEVMSGWGYEASGYLRLPTRGGIGFMKRKGDIKKLEEMGPKITLWDQVHGIKEPTMRASFRLNDTLDYSLAATSDKVYLYNAATTVLKAGNSGDAIVTISEYVYNPATCSGQVVTRAAGGSLSKPKIEQTSNFPDPGEEGLEADGGARLSPYDPTDATRYRLVRSYRLPLSSVPGAVGAGKTVAAPMASAGTDSLPRMLKAAPADIRDDGYYSERHSGLAYWIWEASLTAAEKSFNTFQGTASFWFKPNFDPAYSGKVRSIASVSRYHRKNFYYRNPSPFTLFYMPAFNGGTGEDVTFSGSPQYSDTESNTLPTFEFTKVPLFRSSGYRQLTGVPRSSLVFQIAYSTFDGIGWGAEDTWQPGAGQDAANNPFTPQWTETEMYWASPNLNKKALGKVEDDLDGLRAHRWSHVAMTWWIGNEANFTQMAPNGQRIKVMINGRSNDGEQVIGSFNSAMSGLRAYNNGGAKASPDRLPRIADTDFIDHTVGLDGANADERWHFPGDRWEEPQEDRFILNTFRLGEASTHSFSPDTFTRNFSSDGTYDEFYFWKDTVPTDMGDMGLASSANPNNLAGKKFLQGRYYVPMNGDEDSMWTSPLLTLKGPIGSRELANPTKNVATGAGIKADRPADSNMTTTETQKTTVRLLGVAWTWYAEKYGNEIAGNTLGGQVSMVPVMVDYQNPAGPSDLKQDKACARIYVTVDNLRYPLNDPNGLANDAFSPIQDQAGQALSLGDGAKFQYHVKFKVEGADMSTVLLSSPVLDDVTFYYLTPDSAFLQYVERPEIE